MNIRELYSQREYEKIINENLNTALNFYIRGNPTKDERQIEILYYLLGACFAEGYYCDCLDVLKKLNELREISLQNWNPECLAYFSNVSLESFVYCLFNNQEDQLGIEYDIEAHIESVLAFQRLLVDQCKVQLSSKHDDLVAVFNDYRAGKIPIYIIEYLYPYEPVVRDYVFDMSACPPYISFEVKKEPRETDCFTVFRFKRYGLTRPDMFWKGPRWSEKEKMPAVRKTLGIVNLMMLQAVKASPGKMVMPYSIEQVSTVSLMQYRWDEKEAILQSMITGTDFTATWVGGNARWNELDDEGMKELNRRLVETYGSKHFVSVFHNATNLLSGGFYMESFLMLCSCCEAMVYHWCGELAKKHNIEAEYHQYRTSEFSKCDTCELQRDGKILRNYSPRKPTLTQNITFLKNKGCITTKKQKELNKMIRYAKNEELRNKVVHGETDKVKKRDVEESLEAVLRLQSVFVDELKK